MVILLPAISIPAERVAGRSLLAFIAMSIFGVVSYLSVFPVMLDTQKREDKEVSRDSLLD